jgi:hypothetical protein
MRKQLYLISMILLVSRSIVCADFGIFVHPVLVGSDQMALPLPAGIEVGYGQGNIGVSVAYSRLQTGFLMIDAASLNNQLSFGSVYSSYFQWHSLEGVSNGLIAEAGAHYVTAEKYTCVEMDRSDIGCIARGTAGRNGFDISINTGYGGSMGFLRYYGLIGYRYQSLETKSIPIDARIGLGLSWPWHKKHSRL